MKLPILQYGDPILRMRGKRLEKIDERIHEITQNMIETMHAANGVGLAAQQVGEALQLTVLDVSQVEDRPSTMKLNGEDVDPKAAMPLVLINPELKLAGETELATEACLSFPEITGGIERPKSVFARARTLDWSEIQHEVDHLNGVLFIDRMNSAAKAALSSRLKRMQKETRRGRTNRQVHATQSAL